MSIAQTFLPKHYGGRASYHAGKFTPHPTTMKVLHTITCTAWSAAHNAHQEFTRHLIRDRRLTLIGCERILNRDRVGPPISVTRVQASAYQTR